MKQPRRAGISLSAISLLITSLIALAACDALPEEEHYRPDIDHRRINAPGPPCQHAEDAPYRNITMTCIEAVYNNITPPEAAPALTGVTLAPDGTLYFAHTAAGEIWAQRDADGDQFMDAPERVAAGLRLPLYLAPAGDDLLVTTLAGLVRLPRAEDGGFGEPVVLLDAAGLGAESGVWPGAVHTAPDGRIYAGIGASADQPGMVISLAPDGSDRHVIANGLRHPVDFAWHPVTGDLWIADSRGPDAAYDALFRVPAGATTAPDFGYPACVQGRESACADVPPPTFTFPTGSTPAGMQFYTFDVWPFWQGDLIVSLAGSWNTYDPTGYAVVVIDFGADHAPTGESEVMVPTSERENLAYSLAEFSIRGLGFYPYHPAGIALDAQGWLYVGVAEGRVYRMRPRPANRPGGPMTPIPPPVR